MNINWIRSRLTILTGILLGSGLIGVLLTEIFDKQVTTVVQTTLNGGMVAGAVLLLTFVPWNRVFAGAGNGLARAGHAALGAVGQKPWLYLAIFLGVVTLISIGVAAYQKSLGWLQIAVICAFLTGIAGVTYNDSWDRVRENWLAWLLGLSLLGIPLNFLFGGNLKTSGLFALSALLAYAALDWDRVSANWDKWWLGFSLAGIVAVFLFDLNLLLLVPLFFSTVFAFITVMDAWGKVGEESGKMFFGGYNWYLSGGMWAFALSVVGVVLYYAEQYRVIPRLPRRMLFGEPYPEILLGIFMGVTLIAFALLVSAFISSIGRSANNSVARHRTGKS